MAMAQKIMIALFNIIAAPPLIKYVIYTILPMVVLPTIMVKSQFCKYQRLI